MFEVRQEFFTPVFLRDFLHHFAVTTDMIQLLA